MLKVLVQMVSQLNKEIEIKVKEIVNYIQNTKEYKNYLKAKDLLNQDEELKSIIKNIKKYQQDIVKKNAKKDELEEKIDECLEKLHFSPLYNEYEMFQNEVNNMLIIFENKINKYFKDVFNQVVYESRL